MEYMHFPNYLKLSSKLSSSTTLHPDSKPTSPSPTSTGNQFSYSVQWLKTLFRDWNSNTEKGKRKGKRKGKGNGKGVLNFLNAGFEYIWSAWPDEKTWESMWSWEWVCQPCSRPVPVLTLKRFKASLIVTASHPYCLFSPWSSTHQILPTPHPYINTQLQASYWSSVRWSGFSPLQGGVCIQYLLTQLYIFFGFLNTQYPING